jgi:excisionase family DNA binding protein
MTVELLTIDEAAQAIDCSPTTVTRWIKSGRLPAVTLPSGRYRVRRDDLDKLLTSRPAR